jgi:hypothetical protein
MGYLVRTPSPLHWSSTTTNSQPTHKRSEATLEERAIVVSHASDHSHEVCDVQATPLCPPGHPVGCHPPYCRSGSSSITRRRRRMRLHVHGILADANYEGHLHYCCACYKQAGDAPCGRHCTCHPSHSQTWDCKLMPRSVTCGKHVSVRTSFCSRQTAPHPGASLGGSLPGPLCALPPGA